MRSQNLKMSAGDRVAPDSSALVLHSRGERLLSKCSSAKLGFAARLAVTKQ